ncbi:site-specific DNA methylase [Rubidibacter lacunae KORDI 51-2]|uniref:site-specific DNA-methyltransferase (adenine-specific) n=1 Tax=Rubidibacter lacunae KORDI 51-2 TaxID=582515 RepID=U5DNG1_9CHRO|nr:DNA adenine methylase [Rubidibacter lacunae]ERN43206.1 site-specific DNA methylase [Rubidibacter lacunae KORDI 51-2]
MPEYKIKSPLRYPGGKSKAISRLSQYIPPFQELREPFFGGGSVSFYCAQIFPNTKLKASDINYDLYCFWEQLSVDPDPLIEHVWDVKFKCDNGRALYQELCGRRDSDLSDLQRAVDFFILNRITFSGTIDSGGYSEKAFQSRFTTSSIERLEKAKEIARQISFHHADYHQLLCEPGYDVFLFLDPPYYSATKSKLYGKKGDLHMHFDHQRFFEELVNCKHRWLVTYDNSEYIRELYADFYQLEWELQYGMNNYKKTTAARGKELLIANFELVLETQSLPSRFTQ